MVYYFLGWYHEKNAARTEAVNHYKLAQKMPNDYCFPNRLEEVIVLQAAINIDGTDAIAAYYLGNFWYATKQYDAAQVCWETSVQLDGSNPICHRNLALLHYNKTDQKDLAKNHLERAFELDNGDARLFMELDQLYKKLNISIEERLRSLEKHLSLTESRDDLYLERAALYNFKGHYQKALQLIGERKFHPWEGGEGKVPFQYITANMELAKIHIKQEMYEKAIKHLKAAQLYPHNLGEGKLFGAQENDIYYWLGFTYDKLGKDSLAKENWHLASEGLDDPSPAMFYNDQQPDKIFYQGLALQKLNRPKEAEHRFQKLIDYGETHMDDIVRLDYFAVSLPDLLIWDEDLNLRNKIHCYYLIGLGRLGLQEIDAAVRAFQKATNLDPYHMMAGIHLKMAEEQQLIPNNN